MNLDIINAILPPFLVMVTGYVMQRQGWLSDGLDSGLMKLALNLLLPCLILDSFIGNEALDNVPQVLTAVAFGFGTITLGIVICLLVGPLVGLQRGSGKRTFALTTAIQNYGFLALPVVAQLFGDAPKGILFLNGSGVEIAVWTVGLMTLGGSAGSNWKAIFNMPFLAVVAGLILHYAGADTWLSEGNPIHGTIHMLGVCGVPMALFIIGATICIQVHSKEGSSVLRWPTVAAACMLRLVLLPAILLAVVSLFEGKELQQVILVQAAMPSAVMPIIIARLYNGHVATAVQIVVATTVVSLFTMPFVIELGARWLEIDLSAPAVSH